ncbi:MAG: SIR2 family protein [Betaproteobacteria bacterium]|nr:SIR2 family protein [Betaproteobacteria bacterium]
MSTAASFPHRLEAKVEQQLRSQHVGYLLGAGASYLEGKGFPLAGEVWKHISANIPASERSDIQAKLDGGANGIEHALDLLDDGSPSEKPHRFLVTEAIAAHFSSIVPLTEHHQSFVRRLATRQEITVPLYCLNYDGLIERAADTERVRVVDGFLGLERSFFDAQAFQERFALTHRGPRKPQADWKKGILHLYKLHGSLGWFDFGVDGVRRLGFGSTTPDGAKRLMVPPQRRKATDTTAPPYAALWSDFRAQLCHGPNLLNRLVSIGYGLRDEHVNAVIENSLARTNFTCLAFARSLTDEVFDRWSKKSNVVVVTRDRCSLNGEIGPGHPSLWRFEELTQKV